MAATTFRHALAYCVPDALCVLAAICPSSWYDMRTPFFAAIILAIAPALSFACSCAGTQSIGAALATAESVVVGQVKERTAPDYSTDQPRPGAIVVDVVESLKGHVTGPIRIAESLMCYTSFRPEDLKIGKSYVFPLTQIDFANSGDTFDLMIESEKSKTYREKMYRLPVCSHNALLLTNQKLFTNELIAGGGRRLAPYMSLGLMKILLATGLLSVGGFIGFTVIGAAICFALWLLRKRRSTAAQKIS